MKDLKNAGKFYAHYLKPYWIEFLITTTIAQVEMPTKIVVIKNSIQ